MSNDLHTILTVQLADPIVLAPRLQHLTICCHTPPKQHTTPWRPALPTNPIQSMDRSHPFQTVRSIRQAHDGAGFHCYNYTGTHNESMPLTLAIMSFYFFV